MGSDEQGIVSESRFSKRLFEAFTEQIAPFYFS
jgi:hypothetical protein